jgi:hypothetical protein
MKIHFAVFTFCNAALAVVCVTQLIPSSLAIEGTCSSGDDVCTEQPKTESNVDEWKACSVSFRPSKPTTLPDSPDVWQKSLCWDDENATARHDLIIFGAGIGGAYLSNQLRVSQKHNASIALMEAGQSVGGRLMSSFHSGALGLPVRPFNEVDNVAPPEYGGMRIAPMYKLVFDQVIKLWNREFKRKAPEDAQCDFDFCNQLDNVKKCCTGLLTPMNVGRVHYHNANKKLGGRSMNATLVDKNDLYDENEVMYSVEHIKNYEHYSPYVQCVLLAEGVHHYSNSLPTDKRDAFKKTSASEGFAEACSAPACDAIEGFCGLCSLFPESQAAAVNSCSGYDLDIDKYSPHALIHNTDEVLNIKGKTFLYLFTVGYQRLVQSILSGLEVNDDGSGYKQVAVAPHFRKKLVAIGVGPGDFEVAVNRARVLAQRQVDRFLGKPVEDDDGPYEPIQYLFSDGSMSNSHLGYLTMLPMDIVGSEGDMTIPIRGLEPWREQVFNNTISNMAFKAVIEWEDFSLAEELGMVPCLQIEDARSEAGLCDRIILDGDPKTQVVRQAWPWDYKQILLYTAGSDGSATQNNINTATESGMEVLLKEVMADLQAAVEGIKSKKNGNPIVIPEPAWFRAKFWPTGSLLINWAVGSDGESFSDHIRRPFGDNTHVWYGNSELCAVTNYHGWAEGALSMVNTSLPEIEETLQMYVKQDKKD